MEFLKELTHDFGQNLEISSLFVFGQNGPWSHILDDHVVKKQAILDYKKYWFYIVAILDWKGGNPWFTSSQL